MCVQAFSLRQDQRAFGRSRRCSWCSQAQDVARFMNPEPKPYREGRRAQGGSTSSGPATTVAHGLRRVAPQEDRAGMAHLLCETFRIGGGDLQMFGAQASASGAGIVQLFHHDDGAIVVPPPGGDLLAGQNGDLAFGRRGHLVGKTGIVSDQDALRGTSCSAWLSRSAAIHSGSLAPSAITRNPEGRKLSMPAWPKTSRLAAAT